MNSIRRVAIHGLLVGAALVCPRIARAEELSADDKAFFDKHIAEIVKVEPTRLADAAFVRVFSVPIFHVKVVIKLGEGGEESNDVIVARMDDKLVNISRPSTDADMPDFPKMLNPSFKLKTDADAKDVQAVMDVIYPLITDEEKKAESFSHSGNQWTFIRGKFFDHHMGFVFETDESGAIKSAKYSLKLP